MIFSSVDPIFNFINKKIKSSTELKLYKIYASYWYDSG